MLLDLYRSRLGQAVKRHGDSWNGPCPLCGGEPGKSDRFVVWPERSEHLGELCSQHGIRGIWWCRQCGASGDTIAYLTRIDGLSFKDALAELGIQGAKKPWRRRKAPTVPASRQTSSWEPKLWLEPAAAWSEQAGKLVAQAEKNILDNPFALHWLGARGIGEAAIRQYRLGYLGEESQKYHGRFRPRKAFGLPPKTGRDGKVHDKLFIPRGIAIPSLGKDGKVLNLRIRRHKADIGAGMPKYMELEGSCHRCLFLPSSLPKPLAVYFITEAELDAMLIHHTSGGVVGAVAVRTNRGKPDSFCHPSLVAAVKIYIALDYDAAGAEGCDFWEETYPNAVRWPVPEGKDPGDAFALGVDIREWIEAALPGCVRLPDNEDAPDEGSIPQISQEIQAVGKNGQAEPSSPGQNSWGKGASPNFEEEKGSWPSASRARVEKLTLSYKTVFGDEPVGYIWASPEDFTEEELFSLRSALPKGTDLSDIPLDVAVLWLLWKGAPIAFISRFDEQGNCAGFKWEYDFEWKGRNEERFERLMNLQAGSRICWSWLSDLPVEKITSRNLLRLYELLANNNNGAK